MAMQEINLGNAPTGTGGDTVREAFGKCNDNFTEAAAGIQQNGLLLDTRFKQLAALIKSMHPDMPVLSMDFENRSYVVNALPVSPEELFVPGFRPADKLVWNGSAFEVAPAGQLAYMTHPHTGRRMMVAEPTATNILPYSSDFSISNWGGSLVGRSTIAGIFPGQAGYLLTNNHETSPSTAITRAAGPLTGQPQTVYAIAKKGSSSVARLALRDMEAAAHIVHAAFNFDERSLSLTSQLNSGLDISGDFLELGNGIFLLWATVTAVNAGNEGRAYFYPGADGPGTGTNLYHVQVENAAYWTSPIVTGATALTRAADVLRIADYDQKVIGNNLAGTIFAEHEYPTGSLDSNNFAALSEEVPGTNARVLLYPAGNINGERAYVWSGGVPSYATAVSAAGHRISAGSFSAAQLVVASNGVSGSAENEAGLPVGVTSAMVGGIGGSIRRPIWITKITRDHIVRTAAQLEEMTS